MCFRSVALIFALMFPASAFGDLSVWNLSGAEAKVCENSNGGFCVALTCASGGRLLLKATGKGMGPGQGRILVDGSVVGSGKFGGSRNTALVVLDPRSNDFILSRMSAGARMQVAAGRGSTAVSLSGSSSAISAIKGLCTRKPAPYAGTDNVEAEFERLEDESQAVFEELPIYSAFSKHRDLDIWGGDIRSGLTDARLKGLTENACARLCLATKVCGAYTFNKKDGNVCFLKTGPGRMESYQGAVTGVKVVDAGQLLPPPTRGPLPRADGRVAWFQHDTHRSHAERVRDLAAHKARSCEAERADLATLVSDLSVDLPTGQFVAGEPVPLLWGGNSLIERIPVWLVVSSPALVRFDSTSAMVLGPSAPNPFGISAGAGETRAMVSLWARGAGSSGTIQIVPLRSGEMPVQVSVVAWLRECGQELLLSSDLLELDVAPAPAELVVGTEAGRADLTHSFNVPAFDRRIEFGEHRLRLTSLSDGTEIIERDGSQLRLSPSGRFLLLGDEVVDIVDGASIGSVRGAQYWAAGESFLLGTVSPWGSTDLASTFGAREIIEDQTTAPSCCAATPETTHFALDLENGIVTLRGPHGHSIGSIQGVPYAREVAGNAYASESNWSEATQLEMTYSLGTVSPVNLGLGFSAPDLQPVGPLLTEQASPIERRNNAEGAVVASLFRGRGAKAVSAFERIGIELKEGHSSRPIIESINNGPSLEQIRENSKKRISAIKDKLAQIESKYDWEFDIVPEPSGLFSSSDCFSFLKLDGGNEANVTNQSIFPKLGALALPAWIEDLVVIENGSNPMLLGRIECQAGATGGTLRGQSYLIAHELKQGAQPELFTDGVVLGYAYMAADRTDQFHDWRFSARMFGQIVVAQNGVGGGILVFDAKTRRVLREWKELPSGNLLIDAFLTTEGDHVVQINSDGGFIVHKISDGAVALYGRIVDDEIAVWTKDYRYDATAEADTLIDLRFPGLDGQFSLDRFDPVLRSPGLAKAILSGADIPPREVPIPPDLEGTIELRQRDVVANAKLVNRRRAATELRLYQDGVLTGVEKIPEDLEELDFSVARLPGARHASMIAVDANGLASNAVTVDLGQEFPGGVRRMLAVAVDVYQDPLLQDLNYAKADAERLMLTLSGLPETAPSFEEPRFVGGRHAKPGDVLDALSKMLEGLGPSDHAVLFLAGHGLLGPDGTFYLAMNETDVEDLARTALPFNAVSDLLGRTQARVTVLLDACHSGTAGNQSFATNDGVVSGLTSVPSNLTILAASKGRQQSIEADVLEGGLFSVALERVLSTERELNDSDGNGRIEAGELLEGVRRIVSAQSEQRQVPWMWKGRIVGDYALF